MIDVTMSSVEQVRCHMSPTDTYGNPAPVDDVPTWRVVSGDVTVEPAADGLSALIISGAVGDSVVEVAADADLGDGLVPVTDRVNVRVTDPMATNLGLAADAPEPKRMP